MYLLMFVTDVVRKPSPPVVLTPAEPSPDEMIVQVFVSDVLLMSCNV